MSNFLTIEFYHFLPKIPQKVLIIKYINIIILTYKININYLIHLYKIKGDKMTYQITNFYQNINSKIINYKLSLILQLMESNNE